MENIKVGIGIVFALIIQTSGMVYWAAQQASTLEQLGVTVAKLESRIASGDMINLQRDTQELNEDLDKLLADVVTMKNDIYNSATFGELRELKEEMEKELEELEAKLKQ